MLIYNFLPFLKNFRDKR